MGRPVDWDKKESLDEFVTRVRQRVDEFAKYWRDSRESDLVIEADGTENWPLEAHPDEWLDQFDAWWENN